MSPRKAPTEEQLREAVTEVGEALQRAVVLSTDRLQSVFEDAVLRGRMTRRDAEELATNLVTLGRDQAQELRSEVDSLARALPGKITDAVDPRAKRRKRKKKADAKKEAAKAAETKKAAEVKKPVEAKKPAEPKKAPKPKKPKAPAAAAPAPAPAATDPSTQTARDLIVLARTLDVAELGVLREAEVAGKNRATVLAAIDRRLSA